MTQDQIKYSAAGVLAIVLVALLLNPPKKKGAENTGSAVTQVQDFQEVFTLYSVLMGRDLKLEALAAVQQKFKDMPVRRDPFAFLVPVSVKIIEKPLGGAEELEPVPEFEIEGILFNATNPKASIAILSGEEHKPGDIVQGWQMVSITETSVILKKGARRHVVKLYQKE